jgi:hypothetical protein
VLLNAFEQTKPADRHGQRKIWNRRRTRALLRGAGLLPGPSSYTVAQVRALAPEATARLLVSEAQVILSP